MCPVNDSLVLGSRAGYRLHSSVSGRIALRMLYLADILYSLLVYVMPVYCPIEVLPEKLKYLAYASPLTHIVLISIAYTGLSELQPST